MAHSELVDLLGIPEADPTVQLVRWQNRSDREFLDTLIAIRRKHHPEVAQFAASIGGDATPSPAAPHPLRL